MKKFVCFVFFSLYLCHFGLAQQKEKTWQLERVRDSIYIVENGNRYLVDERVVTVKLKPGISKIRKDVKEIRSNRLGYIDLSVPEEIDIENYVSILEKTGEFEIVEYNSIGKLGVVPNDTRRSEQWYLNSINAFSAWDITMGNSDIIVAILDSGTDWGHKDIGYGTDGYSNIDAALGWNYLTGTNNVITTNDHGTMVAGIVGAKTNNNSRGIAGITGGNRSSGVTIMPMCVGNAQGGVAMGIVDDAIIDAVDKGARVINMSFGGGSSTALDSAIAYAIRKNVVLVACSHNQGSSTVAYPASHPSVIAVGAIGQNNSRASFSNYGSALDIVAPGVGILSTTLNNGYSSQDGTSFATPIVSGIAALILSVRPDLTQAQVRQAIESTCTKLSGYSFSGNSAHPNGTWNNQVGHGLVNAYAAVNLVVPKITGSTLVLNAGSTYTLSNTNGASVTWTYSSNLQKLSSNNTSATFKPLYVTYYPSPSDGPGWIQASVDGLSSIRYEVWAGKPKIYGISGETSVPIDPVNQYASVTYNAVFNYKAGIPYGAFEWILNPNTGYNSVYDPVGPLLDITFRDTGQYELSVRATNANGTGDFYDTGVYVYDSSPSSSASSSLYQVYPNPVSDELTVSLRTQLSSVPIQSSAGSQTVVNNAYTVYLFNANGASVRQEVSQSGDQVQLDVSGLPAGIYYLLIDSENGNKPETHKIIVKH